MPFETTDVASKINTQPADPFKLIGGFATLQNTLNQNKMFQAQNLAGQYLSEATGPDGTPDMGRFSASIKQDHRTGPYAAEILKAAQDIHHTRLANQGQGLVNETTQLGIRQAQVANAQRLAAIGGTSSTNRDPALARAENLKNAAMSIANGVSAGIIPPEIAKEANAHLEQFVNSSIMSGAGGEATIRSAIGTPAQVDVGDRTQIINLKSQLGQPGSAEAAMGGAASLRHNLPPTALAVPVDVVDRATGEKTRSVLADFLKPDGTWKDGKSPPLIDAGPLNSTARAALGSAYGPQIAQFEAEAAAAPNTKHLIDTMRGTLDQFQTGPNSDFWLKMRQYASEYGIKVDPNDVKANAAETFNKIAPSLLRQQATMLGMNETDTGRQIAAASIPSSGQTEAGIKTILGMIEGNTDALIAQGKLWESEKGKNGPGGFGTFRTEFSRRMPPSVFQSQYMTPAEIKDMQKGWSEKRKTDWEARREIAKKQGWLPNAE